jgi:hypothetical protein
MDEDTAGNTALDLARSSTTLPAPDVMRLLQVKMATQLPKCAVCEDNPAHVRFKPCGCKFACKECSRRWKRCTECKAPIREKTDLTEGHCTEGLGELVWGFRRG